MGSIWQTPRPRGSTAGGPARQLAFRSSLSKSFHDRAAGVPCCAKTKHEAPRADVASALSLQALMARLSADASALANIVPLRLPLLDRENNNNSEDPVQIVEDVAGAATTPCKVDDATEALERQLKDELEARGKSDQVQRGLQQWKELQERGPYSQEALHPALDVLHGRLRTGSKPGARTDNFKLGLAVEGGGMRGSVTAGGLRAMHDLGIRDVFDAVYGSSAGAMNLTYYLSSQREGTDIYHEDITHERFCNMRRLLHRNEGPALDLSFLLNEVMEHVKPLDWEAVINSPVPLKVVASCLDTLQPVILDSFTSPHDLRECLRASAQVPAVAGPPIEHRGRRLVDAAVFEPVPFRAAISDGCTHVITLCSRPPTNGGWLAQMREDLLANLVKRAVLSPSYMKAAWARELENLRAFGLTTDQMMIASLDPASSELAFLAGSYCYPVIPGPGSRFSPISIDAQLIRAGIEAGEAAVRELVGREAPATSAPEGSAGGSQVAANGMEPYLAALEHVQ